MALIRAADPWASLDAQRASAGAGAPAPAPDAPDPEARTVRFETVAARPASAPGGARVGTGAMRIGAPLVENRPVRKVLDHPLHPSAPAWPFGMGRRATLLEHARVDLAPPDGAAWRSSSARAGPSAFGAQASSHRANAASARFTTAPRVAPWVQAAERGRDEPGPAEHASGVLRMHALGAGGCGARGSAGTAGARRQPPLPVGHFRHRAAEREGEGGAEPEYVPYPLMHVRPIRAGIAPAAGRAPRAPPASGARTFGTARRETALAAPRGAGGEGAGARRGVRPYYVPMTR
ncbi:hypothetical protein KFE25_004374 [Diacronema lutheri]|uniref:Uncharacterized protein n=1 Tax=Diacronema lutheri TaxID=2081491 RepID=A0A8J5X6B9_DIALT|nr:hypothetical protein KFE25_004374 [Diacronema lutheri]